MATDDRRTKSCLTSHMLVPNAQQLFSDTSSAAHTSYMAHDDHYIEYWDIIHDILQ